MPKLLKLAAALILGFLFILAFLTLAPALLAQNVNSRYDNILWTSSYVSGQQVLIPLPGAQVQVCVYPANAVPCTNLSTLYVGPTTLGGTSTNPVISDVQGNFGFWAAAGYYQYTITNSLGQSAGPYSVTLGGSGGGSGPAYALFPSTQGVVFSTSTLTSTPATSTQLVTALNASPSSQLSTSLIPPLPLLIPSTTNVLKGSGVAGSALAAVPGTDYLIPGALPNGTTATTQSPGDSTTKIATDAFVSGNFLPLTGGTISGALFGPNINGQLYPASCGNSNPPSWCSGTTADAWIRAACSQLPAAGGTINFLGLTGTIAASVTCSSSTKQVIMLEDPASPLTITESDGGTVFPQGNGSMFLGPGDGQCGNAGGIHLSSSANITAIVGPLTVGQEFFAADGLCLFGATGATVSGGLLYANQNFANTTFEGNNVFECNTACLKIVASGNIEVTNNWFNLTDGNNSITGTPLVIQGSGSSGGCNGGEIHVRGGQYEHANGGGPEILVQGNGAGGSACSVSIRDLGIERNSGGTPSVIGIKIQDCLQCAIDNVTATGGAGGADAINISQTSIGLTQNVVVSNILGSGAYTNTLNDTTPGGKVLPTISVPQLTLYYSNPGYVQTASLPAGVAQSVGADAMSGQGNFSTGSSSLGTNFGVNGCQGTVTCTVTRTNATAPPGSTFSQSIQITANTNPGTGFNGVTYIPGVSFTAGQTYAVNFWAKSDGTFVGIPTFLLTDFLGNLYCQSSSPNTLTSTWTLYSFSCTPSVSGSSFLNIDAETPSGNTGTFWLGAFTFAPVAPLVPGNLLTSVTPYGIGPASSAQQTITLGTTALLLGNTYTTVAGLALTTSSINGVTPTTGGSATTYLNGAGSYTTPTQTICSGTLALGTAAITSGAAATTVTATCTGLATTDTIMLEFSTSPVAVTGYGTGASGALRILNWPTANTINVSVINNTGSSITPGAMTMNYRVVR